jgi:hypothetical protein
MQKAHSVETATVRRTSPSHWTQLIRLFTWGLRQSSVSKTLRWTKIGRWLTSRMAIMLLILHHLERLRLIRFVMITWVCTWRLRPFLHYSRVCWSLGLPYGRFPCRVSRKRLDAFLFLILYYIVLWEGTRRSVVGWGTKLQAWRSRVQFPMRLLDFSVHLILPAALWPSDRLSL